MNKVCIFLGEGESERYFFPSLICHKFKFVNLEEKSPALFQKADTLWFFPFPPGNCGSKGKLRLIQPQTYKIINTIISQHKYALGQEYSLHYLILHDADQMNAEAKKKKITQVQEAIHKSKIDYSSKKVLLVEKEIESWYIAGLDPKFPYFNKIYKPNAEIFNKKIENIPSPKRFIKSYIQESYHGTTLLGQTVGEYFNIDLAKRRSLSFKSFLEYLQNNLLV